MDNSSGDRARKGCVGMVRKGQMQAEVRARRRCYKGFAGNWQLNQHERGTIGQTPNFKSQSSALLLNC